MSLKRVGVLAGAFNPVTRAHLALADAAVHQVDEVICVVPRVYPHKEFHGAALEDRIAMLKLASGRYRVESTSGGLFIDIARELRQANTKLFFICGRDAAERIIHWDYGEAGAIEKMLEEFSLLVADRGGTLCGSRAHAASCAARSRWMRISARCRRPKYAAVSPRASLGSTWFRSLSLQR